MTDITRRQAVTALGSVAIATVVPDVAVVPGAKNQTVAESAIRAITKYRGELIPLSESQIARYTRDLILPGLMDSFRHTDKFDDVHVDDDNNIVASGIVILTADEINTMTTGKVMQHISDRVGIPLYQGAA